MKGQLYFWVIIISAAVFSAAPAGLAQCEELIIEQISDSNTDNSNISVCGSKAVWQGRDSNNGDWEIYYDDGNNVTQLTDNDTNDIKPKILCQGPSIVWQGQDTNEGDWEIFYVANLLEGMGRQQLADFLRSYACQSRDAGDTEND